MQRCTKLENFPLLVNTHPHKAVNFNMMNIALTISRTCMIVWKLTGMDLSASKRISAIYSWYETVTRDVYAVNICLV